MRILSLFVRHGTTKYPQALDGLRAFYRKRLPATRPELLVVDNALEGTPPERLPDGELVAGCDSHWEFSGFDAGLAHLGARLWDYDLIHLVTSAYDTLYTRYIERFDERMLGVVAGRGAATGHVDYYGAPVSLLGVRSQCWLRTSFIFVPPAELAALGSLVGVRDPAPFFSGDPARPFRDDAPLCETYRKYILDWLTGEGTGQGTTWHSRFALTPETLPQFQSKALAILNEHMLAIRLRRQGTAIVDATWLATVAGRSGAPKLGAFPSWRDQLAARDTDPHRVPRPGEPAAG